MQHRTGRQLQCLPGRAAVHQDRYAVHQPVEGLGVGTVDQVSPPLESLEGPQQGRIGVGRRAPIDVGYRHAQLLELPREEVESQAHHARGVAEQ